MIAGMLCQGCAYLGEPCPACERRAENRAEREPDVESLDPWGRDADYHFPRGMQP